MLKSILKIIMVKNKKCSFNAKVIQSFKSVECGIFCFALILYIENHPHLDILQSVNEYTNTSI